MINIQPIEKRRFHDDGQFLEIHSIFYTIQGEGPFTGYPAIFIRLAGCNLRCPSCDTDYTSTRTTKNIYEDIIPIIEDLAPTIKFVPKLIVITGGEPFRQNITPLIDMLQGCGFKVQVETNGTFAPSANFPLLVTVVCSPKTGKVHRDLLPLIDAYKYVLKWGSIDPLDGLPVLVLDHTAGTRVARPHEGFTGAVYLQPMDPGQDNEQYLQNVQAVKFSCMEFGYILQLQVHKIIGVA